MFHDVFLLANKKNFTIGFGGDDGYSVMEYNNYGIQQITQNMTGGSPYVDLNLRIISPQDKFICRYANTSDKLNEILNDKTILETLKDIRKRIKEER